MNTIPLTIIGTGLFFLFIFLSGFVLSRSGKPYGSFIFNVHKLIGLAAGIFLVVTVYGSIHAAPLHHVEITAIVATVLIFVVLVAAGGLLSIDATGGLGSIGRPVLTVISMVHKLFPYLAVLSTACTLYLLLSHK